VSDRPCNYRLIKAAEKAARKQGRVTALVVNEGWAQLVTFTPGSVLPDFDALSKMDGPDYMAAFKEFPNVESGSSFPLDGLSPCGDCCECHPSRRSRRRGARVSTQEGRNVN
jgi:hypothetical protein